MAEHDLSGRVLADRYAVESRLAQGGMAAVWLAWDRRVERSVVVKVPHLHLLGDPTFGERFSREIRSLVDFKHANIVGVLDIGEEEGTPFLVMEFLEGGTLEERNRAKDGYPARDISLWLPSIAEALDYVHGEGMLHRDVKPGNIMFNAAGHAFLSDFGLAKAFEDSSSGLTRSGIYPGSPAFMPPDVLTGRIGPGYDQYSLAAVVLHLFTGKVPPPLRAHVSAEEELPRLLTDEAAAPILRALSIEPDDRFPSCVEFASALGGAPLTRSSSAPPPPRTREAAPVARETDSDPVAASPEAELRPDDSDPELHRKWSDELERFRIELGTRHPRLIVTGDPGSGKTRLLRASGLNPGVRAVGEASGFWRGNGLLLFEARGRDEPSDPAWTTFLDVSRVRPADRAVVVLSADVLLRSDSEELHRQARRIRARLDDLGPTLRSVHVVVSKCDLVSGFVEYFDALDPGPKEQLGFWTFGSDARRFHREEFDERFDSILSRMYRLRCLSELNAPPRSLLRAFFFPEEFEHLRAPIAEILGILFPRTAPENGRALRSVHFTSTVQEGVPVSRALRDTSAEYSLPELPPAEPPRRSRPYFLRGLLPEVIERGSRLDAREARRRFLRRTGLATAAAAVLLAIILTRSYLVNQARLSAFRLDVREGSRPVLVAYGCLVTVNRTPMPSLTDLGLSFTDEVVPRVKQQFRGVTLLGSLVPLVEEIGKPIESGPKVIEREDGTEAPDIEGWLTHWGHYLYLRRALDAELPYLEWQSDGMVPQLPRAEEAHVDRLHAILVSRGAIDANPLAEERATKAQLRRVLVEYGRLDDSVRFPSRGRDTYLDEDRRLRVRLQSLDGQFDRHAGKFIAAVEEYVDANLDEKKRLKGNTEQAFAQLKLACSTYRKEIAPHDSPTALREVAGKIASTGNELNYASGGGRRLTDLAGGIRRPSDLSDLLIRLKGEVSQEGVLPDRIDRLLPKLAPATSDTTGSQRAALEEVVVVVSGFLDERVPPLAFREAPSHEVLKERRAEIAREIEQVGRDVEDEIRRPVEALEGMSIVEQKAAAKFAMENGRPVLLKGWWTTLVLLAKALRADQRKDEYLKDGLRDYLEDDVDWMKEHSREREEVTYRVDGLNEVVLPFLRDQIDFYGDELTAKSLLKETTERSLAGLDGYLDEMEEYWRKRFLDNIPKPATSVADAVDRLEAWKSRKDDFRDTCDEIDKALYDVTKAGWNKADDNHPILRGSAERRDEIFETFAFCFERNDERVDRITTVADAADEFDKLRSSLKQVRRADDAPEILEELIDPDNSYVACLEAADGLTESRSELSRQLGEWARKSLEAAGRDLVTMAAAAINREWKAASGGWMRNLDEEGFRKVFGDSGDFERFRKQVLSPFFALREGGRIEPIKFPEGLPVLRADPAFDVFNAWKLTIERAVIRPDGVGFIEEAYELDLKLGGKGRSLVVEYSPNQGPDQVSPEYRNAAPVEFRLKWTPGNCRSLVFKVEHEGGVDDKSFRWEGDWAVAEAFAKADELVGDDTYVWRTRKEGVGDYEVRLTLRGGHRLLKLYRESGGAPLKALAESIPTRVISVR